MVGIKDLAAALGVSISTVSYAMNNNPKIPLKTRERVQKKAAEMGYQPNIAGKMLKRQRNNLIGIYFHDFGGYFYADIVEGIRKIANQHGYEVIVCVGDNTHSFISRGLVDAAIILDVDFPTTELIKFANQGARIVCMDRTIETKNISNVRLNNTEGAQLAITNLLREHVKSLVFVTGPSDSFDSNERLKESLEVMEQHQNIPFNIIQSDFTIDGGKRVGKQIFSDNIQDVGIFSFNDEMAVGILDKVNRQTLTEHNFHLVGFDNDLVGEYVSPRLTTINYSKVQWGSLAAEKLIALLENDTEKAAPEVLSVELVQRES